MAPWHACTQGFVFWSVLTGAFHFTSLVIHIADERPITFKDEDTDQLWRCFYRCGDAPAADRGLA